MKTRLATIALLCIVATPIYMYDLVNYSINQNKQKIEDYIKKETNQDVKLGDIHLSFSSLKVSDVKYSHKNVSIDIKDVEILPSQSFLFGFEPNKLVKSIYIKSIDILPKKDFEIEETKPQDYSFYLDYVKGMKTLEIDKITYSNILSINKTIFQKEEGTLKFNTTAKYHNNSLQAKGSIDLYKVLKTSKVDAEVFVDSNKLELSQLNQFINTPEFVFVNGNVEVEQKLKIKDNNIQFSGQSNIRNLKINLFNKPIKVNDLHVKTEFSKDNLELEFKNDIKVNNIPFDIKRISLVTDSNVRNIKKVTIASKNLNYHGVFSQKFNEDNSSKNINVNFNVVDLNYFNRLGILEIPKPYNETIVKNGVFDVTFTKDSKNVWHTNYTVSGDASLKIDDVLFEANSKLEYSKLSFNNFKLNGKNQEGVVNYDLNTNNFDLDIKINVDRPIFSYIKKQYYVPFNIELLNETANLGLKLEQKDNKYIYNGFIGFLNSDLSFNYKNKDYQIKKAQGKIDFSTHQIDSFAINAEKVNNEKFEVNSLAVEGSYKNNIIDVAVNTPNINSKVSYDLTKGSLDINVPKFSYEFKIAEKEAISSDILKSLELPKHINLDIQDLKINDKNLGKISVVSEKQENNIYNIKSAVSNDISTFDIASSLDLDALSIKNNFNFKIENIEKFNKKYALEETIKDGDLKLSGEIETNLKEISIDSLISNSNGKVNFVSENGELAKVHSNAGFIINLLSFQTIPNIATLQFGNIFTNKFNYDKINGELTLTNSNLQINKLDIKSNISDASMNGSINLLNQELNVGLKIKPKLSKSILFTTMTVATGFNPIVMLGSGLLEKIVPVPEMIRYKYRINGTLSYPILASDDVQSLEK